MRNLVTELVAINELKNNPTNVNKHPDDQIETLAKIIDEFGFLVPVVVDKDNIIVLGHGRVMAAKKLGLFHVPVIKADHLTPTQIKAFGIAENKISKRSFFDFELLAHEMDALLDENFDLALTGFDEAEIMNLLKSTEAYLEAEETKVKEHTRRLNAKPENLPEAPKLPRVVPGDIWTLGDTDITVGLENLPAIEAMILLWEKRTGRAASNQNCFTLKDLGERG